MHAGWGERARRESCREQVSNSQKEGMINMNQRIEFNKTIASITKPTSHLPVLQRCGIIALTLMAFVLAQRTQAVNPPPDGGYAGGNTAEGQNALLKLTTGGFNTAVGFLSSSSNTAGAFNTAIGAGTLLANTADNIRQVALERF